MRRPIATAALAAAVLLATPGAALAGAPRSGAVRVAAAADLKSALDEIVARYREARPGVDVTVSYGSSGLFHAQLANGAPFDLFLSADAIYPRRLVEAGVALPGSEFPYAVGRIVLWAPAGSPLPVETEGLEALLHPTVRRIAIANPEHAPYGMAAEAALRHHGLLDRVRSKLVLGQNAAQTAQFAESGSADAAILPLSLVGAPGLAGGRRWLVPLDAHPRLEQVGVRMKASRNAEEARRLAEHLAGPEARAVLRRHGFLLPGE